MRPGASAIADATEVRTSIDESIGRADFATARQQLKRLWRERAGLSQADFVASRWARAGADVPMTRVRARVLRSFTLEPVLTVTRAAGLLTGLDIELSIGDFGTYGQEILDPSSALYAGDLDVGILAVHTRDIAPGLWSPDQESTDDSRRSDADRVAAELSGLVEAFRARSSVPMLVHDLEVPPAPTLGLADRTQAFGQVDAVHSINRRLREVAAELSDVYIVPYAEVIARLGPTETTDERKWSTMRLPLATQGMVAVAHEWLRHLQPIAGRVAKVAVVDLDNTLWGGVLGEEGASGVAVGEAGRGAAYDAVQRALLDLRARGILLAVCSKNDHDLAVDAIDSISGMRVRSHDFHALRINWNDKATNLREIAEELNVGLDSLAFIDDNPAERLLIEQHLPEVAVVPLGDDPSTFGAGILAMAAFERLRLTDEDHRRSDLYIAERSRRAQREQAPDLDSYLRALGTKATVRRPTEDEVARVAQLTRKTNQFNATTRRYNDEDIRARLSDDRWRVYALGVTDRFSDHGIVGVALVERDASCWIVDTLLLSCRVIGRNVETALIGRLAADAGLDGASALIGEIVHTAKNGPARDVFERHGFARVDSADEVERWGFDLAQQTIETPTWIDMEMTDDR